MLLLLAAPELCVCDLTRIIDAPQPHLSRHLAQLRELGLVVDRREGQWIHYRLNPGLPDWVLQVVQTTAGSVRDVRPFSDDLAAVATFDAVGGVRCS